MKIVSSRQTFIEQKQFEADPTSWQYNWRGPCVWRLGTKTIDNLTKRIRIRFRLLDTKNIIVDENILSSFFQNSCEEKSEEDKWV